MQTQKNNTRPVARTLSKRKSNLGNPTDQLKIHRGVYQTYLMQELEFSTSLTERLLKQYDAHITRDTMPEAFALRIEMFHSAFIQKLRAL